MERKRKLPAAEIVDVETPIVKKKNKKCHKNENIESFIPKDSLDIDDKEIEKQKELDSKKKKKDVNQNDSDTNNKGSFINKRSKENEKDEYVQKNENLNSKIDNKQIRQNNLTDEEILEKTSPGEKLDGAKIITETEAYRDMDGDGLNTPTTKKPPRKSGETKKQYKRRMRALREAGLLIDPPVVEGVRKEKKNRKTRKEKRIAKEQKNEELEKFRSIVQINYLKMWKSDQSKWKFNKNVQGKIIKHMFDTSRIPQEIFEILIEYIMGTKKSTKMHEDINKKCSQIVETMEKWSSADETEKKKLTEPDQQAYERARQLLQSLA